MTDHAIATFHTELARIERETDEGLSKRCAVLTRHNRDRLRGRFGCASP